jgi:hypothetical protein
MIFSVEASDSAGGKVARANKAARAPLANQAPAFVSKKRFGLAATAAVGIAAYLLEMRHCPSIEVDANLLLRSTECAHVSGRYSQNERKLLLLIFSHSSSAGYAVL